MFPKPKIACLPIFAVFFFQTDRYRKEHAERPAPFAHTQLPLVLPLLNLEALVALFADGASNFKNTSELRRAARYALNVVPLDLSMQLAKALCKLPDADSFGLTQEALTQVTRRLFAAKQSETAYDFVKMMMASHMYPSIHVYISMIEEAVRPIFSLPIGSAKCIICSFSTLDSISATTEGFGHLRGTPLGYKCEAYLKTLHVNVEGSSHSVQDIISTFKTSRRFPTSFAQRRCSSLRLVATFFGSHSRHDQNPTVRHECSWRQTNGLHFCGAARLCKVSRRDQRDSRRHVQAAPSAIHWYLQSPCSSSRSHKAPRYCHAPPT